MNTLSLWSRHNPLADFDAIVRHAFGPQAVRGFTPAAEVVRDGEDALVRLELPGMDIADVAVELTDGRLHIRGERRDQRAEDDDNVRVREIRYGTFERSFRLPSGITAEQISADYDAGILTVRVSGAYAGSTPRQITVTSGGTALDNGQDVAEADAA